jgi:hypothetical protein
LSAFYEVLVDKQVKSKGQHTNQERRVKRSWLRVIGALEFVYLIGVEANVLFAACIAIPGCRGHHALQLGSLEL